MEVILRQISRTGFLILLIKALILKILTKKVHFWQKNHFFGTCWSKFFECQTTVIFGMMNDGSRKTNNLSIIYCFTCKISLKMALAIFQNWLTCMVNRFCVKKIKISCSSDQPILIKFRQLVVG